MGLATASFSQIADAMAKIKQQLDATPPPADAMKQSLLAAYQNLNDALGDIALDDYAAVADSVGSAAKQLQDVIDSGTANSDPIEQILGTLGIGSKPAVGAPGQAQPPTKPPAAGQAQPPADPPGTTAGGSNTVSRISAIDISSKLGVDYSVSWLRQNNIDTVLRYVSRGDQTKCIDANELQALISSGITVGIIYEMDGGSPQFGGLPASINATSGKSDGDYVLNTLKMLAVPQGVVVYFAVDTDVNNNEDINSYVIPYFQAAKQAMGGYYRTGAYGCGATCAAALDTAGCDKAWLANANLWTGYQQFLAQGRAAIIQGKGPNQSSYDPDTIVNSDWGGFKALDSSTTKAAVA